VPAVDDRRDAGVRRADHGRGLKGREEGATTGIEAREVRRVAEGPPIGHNRAIPTSPPNTEGKNGWINRPSSSSRGCNAVGASRGGRDRTGQGDLPVDDDGDLGVYRSGSPGQ
jgi:hypothetical protein